MATGQRLFVKVTRESLPVATLNTLLLGPGTTITHEAVKIAAAANCNVCW